MKKQWRLNAVQGLAFSFACLILIGGVLLTLPFASKSGQSLPFLDALFTAGSASCVTGLVLYDTFTQFTVFGQAVILLLIQIGGLSVMTVSILVSFLLHRRIGLHRRENLMNSVGALQVGGVVRLTRRALMVTAVIESCGALLLTLWFCPRFGLGKGIWMSIFHAISAYCNAGFDLLGTGASITSEAGEPLLNIVLMLLIISGGLGFLVWDDILTWGRNFRRYRLHSKIVLTGTAILLIGGTVAFYLLERDRAFGGVPEGQKWLMAAFQSVTSRTAGFNSVDLSALSEGSTLITLVLMFIGAGSGSTGGGVKVNTFAVLLLCALANVRRKEDVEVFHRRLDEENVHKAYGTAQLYILTGLLGCLVLCIQGIPLTDALFESVSAMGTVGLTRGLTPSLPQISKIAVLLMMFAGRVGSMSVAMAVTRDRSSARVRQVPEKILIG